MTLDGHNFSNELKKHPPPIEAVFYPIHCPVQSREGDEGEAYRIWKQFRREVGVSIEECPLLTFDCKKAARGTAPFALDRRSET